MDSDPTCGEIIHLAHHAAGDPNLWDEVSALLRAPLSAPLVAFVEHNFITGRGQISHAAGIDRSFRELYGARFAERNVWLHAEHRFKPGQTLTGAELVANWELVRTEFYRHWLRPQEAFHCLVGITFRCAEEIRCLIALRPLAGPAFAAEDKRKLASLLPHLQCADELGVEFAASRLEISILMDLMGALPEAIFVVDAEGRPVFLNIAAERLIARHNGLVLAHGILAANSNKETAGPIEAFDPELVAGLHHLDHRNVRTPSIVRLDLRRFGWPGQIDFEGCPRHGPLPQVECFIGAYPRAPSVGAHRGGTHVSATQ